MRFAELLGLLGLLSIIVLIIIYLIKPNYQQKIISSTYVWKLSLKYRKKRIPINKLRNLLIVLCQILILTSCALILARPVTRAEYKGDYVEKILIVDASASMKARVGRDTRFSSAIVRAKEVADEVLDTPNGKITLILAGTKAEYFSVDSTDPDNFAGSTIVMSMDKSNSYNYEDFSNAIDAMIMELKNDDPELPQAIHKYCTYGNSDMDGAMALAGEVLYNNPDAEIIVFSGTDCKVENLDNYSCELIRLENEENMAILNGTLERNGDNAYDFIMETAVYSDMSVDVRVKFELTGVNKHLDFSKDSQGISYEWYSDPYTIADSTPQIIRFDSYIEFGDDENSSNFINGIPKAVYSFDMVKVTLQIVKSNREFIDALTYDNEYIFYGGTMPDIRLHYFTDFPNAYTNKALNALASIIESDGNYNFIISTAEGQSSASEPGPFYATMDYNIYIYEHEMPEELPNDGLVIMIDPDPSRNSYTESAVTRMLRDQAGLSVANTWQGGYMDEDTGAMITTWDTDRVSFVANQSSTNRLLSEMDPSNFEVTKLICLKQVIEGDYEELMYCDPNKNGTTYPTLLLKDTKDSKVVVLCVDNAMSDLGVRVDYPYFFLSIFDYFFPQIIPMHTYNIGETVIFNGVGEEIVVTDGLQNFNYNLTRTESMRFVPTEIGSYTIEQNFMRTSYNTSFFVRVPAEQSNLFRETEIASITFDANPDYIERDIIIYFAAALLALLFIEWWLQSRENF